MQKRTGCLVKGKVMLEFSNRSNLLEQTEYKYRLQDVDKPKLYRDLYDYTSIPKTPFNHRMVPRMSPKYWITALPRDRQESAPPFHVAANRRYLPPPLGLPDQMELSRM